MAERREKDVNGPEGEDHRDGPPGYDLDEQRAIEDLRRREQGAGDVEAGEAEDASGS